jgi:superfamily II DNA/RNA helicase
MDFKSDTKHSNPISSLLSDKTWEDLDLPPNLITILRTSECFRFDRPSHIQAYIMEVKKNLKEDPFTLVVQSKNGSGKTISFCLPAITSINLALPTEINNKLAPQVLIFCNTNELVFQTEEVLKNLLSKASPIRVAAFLKNEANRSKEPRKKKKRS